MLKAGMMIGDRYEIIGLVGSGGMADVYKAKCHKLNRFVAIKVLKREFSEDKTFLTKFRVEAQSAAGLSHPNIVNVYDVGDDDGIYYIVMELVEGITLKDYIRENGRMDVKQAINFAVQIAAGIEVAHNNHTIHRDIKPQNIIVSNNGNLKVTDFGIAKAATSTTVASNTAMGSVHYISPEQARGGYSDERSDIYSLGITMYEMVTGKVPFEGDNNVTVALMHIQGDMIPPREYYPDIPPTLEQIILKCTQKKPERRYLTASALIGDLKRVLANPNGDFVRMVPTLDTSPTVMISEDEVSRIKTESSRHNGSVQAAENPRNNKTSNHDRRRAMAEVEDDEIDQVEDDDSDDDAANEGRMDPKMEKLVIVLGIVAAVIVGMLILFFVGRGLNMFKFNSKEPTDEITTSSEASTTPVTEGTTQAEEVEVPALEGKNLTAAKELLDSLKLKYEIETKQSNVVAVDCIITQDIAAGTKVEPNSSILLTVSTGKEKVAVPNVLNMAEDKAKAKIEDEDLNAKREYIYHDTVEKGNVIKQSPAQGSMVDVGSNVTIYISDGPEITDVSVPNLTKLNKTQAIEQLTKAGLKLGDVTQEYNETVAQGLVIDQDYKEGSKLPKGSAVSVTISKGPEPVEYTYKARVIIPADNNPFTEEGESGVIELRLEQNGKTKTIFRETLTYSDFPYDIGEVEGMEEGNGIITIYLNGVKQDGVIYQPFSKVKK